MRRKLKSMCLIRTLIQLEKQVEEKIKIYGWGTWLYSNRWLILCKST